MQTFILFLLYDYIICLKKHGKVEMPLMWLMYSFSFQTCSSQKALGGQIKGNEAGNMKHKLTTHQYMFNRYQQRHKCKLKWYVGSNKYDV